MLRDAYRRTAPNALALFRDSFETRSISSFLISRFFRISSVPNSAAASERSDHDFRTPVCPRQSRGLASTRITSFTWARRLLGCLSRKSSILANQSFSRSSPAKRARCVLPTNAIHYLTNCTRALGFFGSLRLQLTLARQPCFSLRSRSQKDRCVSRRLRSLPRENPFLRARSIRSRSSIPFASPVSSPASVTTLHLFEWLSWHGRRTEII